MLNPSRGKSSKLPSCWDSLIFSMDSLIERCLVGIAPCGLVRILFSTICSTGTLATLAGLFTGAEELDFRSVCFGKGIISILSVSPFFFQTLVLKNRVASVLLR